ncbi:unnamed protein product [Psylliodes chrysocephalus]|uniref:Uncharacterized protein n=1 Tax=Psylliodes chrysocephalus TaxID=3402493 RepID=A0A9P0D3H3_9CUCU|nr:unnamed protein product [Psylliodes chrysocephala]
MNESSTDAVNHLICRLCSHKARLISLFKGKSRSIRDLIRKMVAVTIGIKYEEDNYFDCICSSCIIETYNLLVFKTKCLKNEEKLQALIPNIPKKSDSGTKLSDIELPNYTELKHILTNWLRTKSFISTESSGSSGESSSSPACAKTKIDKSTQTHSPKCFNVSIQNAFMPIIPKVTIETQTNLIKTINADIQCNLGKKESSKRPRIKDKYTQCDLLKIQTKKPKGFFDVYTQTIDLKTENNNEAIITGKYDSDKYSCVHKTLNNRIKNINSDKNKTKKLKDKLKQHKSSKNIDELFEPLKTDKAAVGLEFTIKKNSSDSSNDSTELKMVDNSCNLTQASNKAQSHEKFTDNLQVEKVNDSGDKLVTETLIKSSKQDESKNVRPRRNLSFKSELKTPSPLQVKETLPKIITSPLNTTDTNSTEASNKAQSHEKVTDNLQVEQVNDSGDKLVTETLIKSSKQDESKNVRPRRNLSLKSELKTPSPLQVKETLPKIITAPLNTTDTNSTEASDKAHLNENITDNLQAEQVNDSGDKLVTEMLIKDSKQDENKNVRPRRNLSSKSKLKTPSPLKVTETLPIIKSPLNTTDTKKSGRIANKSHLSQSDERATSGLLKVTEPVTSPKVKETNVHTETPCQSNKNRRSEDRKVDSEYLRPKRKQCLKPETPPNINRLQIKETLPIITKSPCNTDSQKCERLQLGQSNERATSGLLKVAEPVTSPKVKETNIPSETSSQPNKNRSEYRKIETEYLRPKRKSCLKPETPPNINRSQIKEALPNITKSPLDSEKFERLSNKLELSQSNEKATSRLLKVTEPVTSPNVKETNSPIEISFQSNKNLPFPDSSVYKLLNVDCQKSDLLEVKVEQDSPNLINLDTSIVLKSSPVSYDNEPSPNNEPSLNDDSPNSSGLLQTTGKVEYLRTCPECGRIIHTKNELVEHRKSHMKCYLCKKRFKSIKKTKEHMNSDCIRKLDSTNPVITLMKIEDCQTLTNQYPNVLEQITQSPKKRRRNDHSEENSSRKKIVFLPSTSSE